MVRRPLILLLLHACAPPDDAPDPNADAVQVVTTTASLDYTVGQLAVAGLDDDAAVDVATVHSDAVVRSAPGGVYVVNRLLMDTVRYYPTGAGLPAWEASVGPGTNPHAAARCGERLYVSRYEHTALVVLDPDDGAAITEVDLAAFADDDGLPEVSDLVVAGDRLVVGMQRLRRDHGWAAEAHGELAVLDCATGAVPASWEVGPNPVVRAWDDTTVMVIAEDGVSFVDLDAGPQGAPAFVDGDARPVDGWADGRGGAVLIARRDADHAVWCVDRDGRWDKAAWEQRFLSGVVAADGRAWVASRAPWTDPSGDGGIARWDLGACAQIGLITTTLPPYSVALSGG